MTAEGASGAWQRLRAWIARLATAHGSPIRLFFACFVGAIVGTTPLFGLHIFVCVALAKLLRLNQVVVYAAANVSLPPLAPFLGAACIEVGGRLLHGQTIVVSIESLRGASPWHIARALFADWMLGAPFIGGAIGIVLGSIVGGIAFARKTKNDPFHPVVKQIDRRFARAPIGMRQYAWWKVRLDPAYRAIANALTKETDVIDLGTGMGILPIVLALSDEKTHVRGVDHDSSKITEGKRAAEGLKVELEVGDVRTWTIPECDAVVLMDVLHYFDEETQRAIVERAFRSLREGGALIVRDGDREARGSLWTRTLESIAVATKWNRGARPTWRSIADLRAQLEALGAKVEVTSASGDLHPGNVLVIARK